MVGRGRTRGFTVVGLAATVVIVALLSVVVLALLGREKHVHPRPMKDSSQVRGVLQALVIWAQNNADRFPLPSLLDVNNDTVPEEGPAKDTSAHIISILLYNGFLPTDILVSPAEANPNIQKMEGYTLDNPPGAVNPSKALWDPAFNADFTGPRPGNLSYAHAVPRGLRRGKSAWSLTFEATHPVLANRGPQVGGLVADGRGGWRPRYLNPRSNTFLIHGARDRWEGNVGYNDNHVQFETTDLDPAVTYALPDGTTRPDCIFFDEPDDPAAANNFLGIFIRAGAERKDFAAIWD